MQTVKPYLFGAIGVIYIITSIFIYKFGYKNGSNNVTLKVQQATLKQQNNTITKANSNIDQVNIANAKQNSINEQIVYKTRTLIKYIKESQVCSNGKVSQQVINLINKGAK